MRNVASAVALVVVLGASIGTAAAEAAGGRAGAFLEMFPGARPAGMGSAFTAVADDANAVHFNPGGLYQVDGWMAGVAYGVMSMDRSLSCASLVNAREPVGSFGLSATVLGVSDIDGRDDFGNPVGSFSDTEISLAGAYAKQLLEHLGIGSAVKYVSHYLDESRGNGLGFDAGLHSRFDFNDGLLRSLRLGATARNLGMSIRWDTTSSHMDEVPVVLSAGVALDFALGTDTSLLLLADGSRTEDTEVEVRVGCEVMVGQAFIVRTGRAREELTFGASFSIGTFNFDYAYREDALDEGATQCFGVGIRM